MFRLLKPVPGKDIDPCTPEPLPLSVSWNGPSLNDLVYDLIPCSVKLIPAIVRSKLIGDFFVIDESANLFGLFEIIFIHLRMNVFNQVIISG
jgi:hypothetical protein